ncbi:universal stress protein [Formosa sp. S-31]|uniref:universal stress protein n=1 Tax=Formosa sp. S-31 TaxID=2790949 RepID=UPI003EB91153
MKRKILIPTDFSDNAWQALNYALDIYNDEPCTFYLLHVFSVTSNIIDSLINMEPGSEMYENARLYSENGLAKLLDKIALKPPKGLHEFETISIFNNPVEGIKQTVEDKDIEMIIMGTRGENDTATKIFGSVAVEVMEKVRNCPVIVVPKKARYNLPKEIVFPTSFKTHFKQRELKHVIDLAKKSQAAIRILHIKTEKELNDAQLANKALLEEYFEGIPYSFHMLSKMDIPTAINCFVESRDSDMVAFINKKHAFFGSLLTHPLVKEISFDSQVPLFVLHDLRN